MKKRKVHIIDIVSYLPIAIFTLSIISLCIYSGLCDRTRQEQEQQAKQQATTQINK